MEIFGRNFGKHEYMKNSLRILSAYIANFAHFLFAFPFPSSLRCFLCSTVKQLHTLFSSKIVISLFDVLIKDFFFLNKNTKILNKDFDLNKETELGILIKALNKRLNKEMSY